MGIFSGALRFLALAALSAAVVRPAMAETGADFFKGKTVTYVVSTKPGGGYDAYARLIAEYMQKYLPGSTFVVKNMPGAGHLIGANSIYASEPDGLTIGTFNTGLIYNQLAGLDAVQFDLARMSWIGKAASDPRVIVVAKDSPVKTLEDLRALKSPLNFATAGVGSAAYVETMILKNALELPIRVMTGYDGNDDQLAMRRGEIGGTIASRSSYETFVDNGYGRFIAQIGGDPAGVPRLNALVTEPAAKKLVALIRSQGEISRLTAGPPGIPEDRLQALREAYRKALDDPELREKAEQLGRPLDPAYGQDVHALVTEALDQPKETVKLLKDMLGGGRS
ncbi:MAG TPA: tripartite tricarboxylate transporter substrate-binding protein [Beijerinckiaceae bacterium]|jgi:tripartite-type tricarboxylate transporter receptor subunit TctC